MNLTMKQTHREREQTCGCQGGGGKMETELGTSKCKLVHTERINNKDLLYRTTNDIQYPVINHNGKEHEKECICV